MISAPRKPCFEDNSDKEKKCLKACLGDAPGNLDNIFIFIYTLQVQSDPVKPGLFGLLPPYVLVLYDHSQ